MVSLQTHYIFMCVTIPLAILAGIFVGNIPLYMFLLVTFLSLLSCVFINICLVCCLVKRKTSKKKNLGKTVTCVFGPDICPSI